jgi:hypothetical protein
MQSGEAISDPPVLNISVFSRWDLPHHQHYLRGGNGGPTQYPLSGRERQSRLSPQASGILGTFSTEIRRPFAHFRARMQKVREAMRRPASARSSINYASSENSPQSRYDRLCLVLIVK